MPDETVKRYEWQPMGTAPRDGREVLLAVKQRAGIQHGLLVGHYMGGGYCIEDHPPIDRGWYFWNGCMFDQAAEPTAWAEMPAHPDWNPGGWQCQKQQVAEDYDRLARELAAYRQAINECSEPGISYVRIDWIKGRIRKLMEEAPDAQG